MYLRNLEEKDAPLMLEWMHDESVVENLNVNFKEKTLDDCLTFIRAAVCKETDVHLAICSDDDEYMGTVSLKCVDRDKRNAEFAITVRATSMGRGYSWFGMKEMIRKGFDEYGLDNVFWCVSRTNNRAIRFYDKHNFHEAVDISSDILRRYSKTDDLKWYSVLKGDVLDDRKEVAGCRIVHINTVPTVEAGELSFFEAKIDVPFDIKRIYYISKVPEGVKRGFHAHKKLKQLLFCPYGKIQLILENRHGREEIELSDPSVGVVIEETTWREMLWLENNSVLCIAASEYYDIDDYIRDYKDFQNYIESNNL